MDVLQEHKKLEEHNEFKKFMRDNKDYYLVHILVQEVQNDLEVGYYNPKKDKIMIFKINPFTKGKEEDVFKEGKTISKLDIKKIKINYSEAQELAKNIIKKEHSAEIIGKQIILLQTISEQLWNMTYVCKSMNIINIRINAETGIIVRNNKSSLLGMAGMMK